jgi:MFS family permease
MLPLAMFANRRFSAASGVSFCLFAALVGALFLMSQYFQTAQGASPLRTGAQLLMWSASGVIVAPIAGRLADRYGNRPFMVAGLVMQAFGLATVGLLARHEASFAALCLPLLVAGSGAALVFPTVANEAVAAVPAERVGIASGANGALRELGGVFGVAILALVFTRPDSYTDHAAFVSGFSAAMWVGAGISAVGVIAALLATRPAPAVPTPDPVDAPAPAASGH